ncbi:hypothetical protein IF2G_04295 [Cordyceps javanica]|nr:hypothetical protein IF2G_04295 [Cordyceps javanica]
MCFMRWGYQRGENIFWKRSNVQSYGAGSKERLLSSSSCSLQISFPQSFDRLHSAQSASELHWMGCSKATCLCVPVDTAPPALALRQSACRDNKAHIPPSCFHESCCLYFGETPLFENGNVLKKDESPRTPFFNSACSIVNGRLYLSTLVRRLSIFSLSSRRTAKRLPTSSNMCPMFQFWENIG